MKKTVIALLTTFSMLLVLLGCSQNSSKVSEVTNVNSFQIELSQLPNSQLLMIPYSGLNKNFSALRDYSSIRILQNNVVLPVQHIDTSGDSKKDAVLVRMNAPPPSETVLKISLNKSLAQPVLEKKTQAEVSVKKNGDWVAHPSAEGKKAYLGGEFFNVQEVTPPEDYTDHSNWIRYEGPGIESDLVGYRIYLDWRNGIDIFGKKVSRPILQDVGVDGYESYHQMADWGMDILKVGTSLGAGGFGFWDGSELYLPKEVESRRVKIVENGDLYSAFQIDYTQWKLPEFTVDLNAQFSMLTNNRLVKTELSSNGKMGNFVIGVVKHENTKLLAGESDKGKYSYIASWGKQSLSGDNLGMAVIFPTEQYNKNLDIQHSYAALMDAPQGNLTYYFLAAWEGEANSSIDSLEAFEAYLKEQVNTLNGEAQKILVVQ